MRRWINFFWIFLLYGVVASLAQLEITEVMYAPVDGNEWIEIFNAGPEAENLSLWKLADTKENDSFSCCSSLSSCPLLLPAQEYLLITDQSAVFFPENVTQMCVDDSAIGNGLHNEGDNLTLSNGQFFDFFSYTKSMGAYRNNKTLEKFSGFWRESLFPFGTPGKRSEERSTTNSTHSAFPTNVSCDPALDISFENPIFHSEKIAFTLTARNVTSRAANISVRGSITTPEGKVMKEYSPWTSDFLSGQLLRSYEPSLPAGIYLLSFWFLNASCSDAEMSNNYVSRLIAIMDSSENHERTDASVEIEEISTRNGTTAAWGESIPVKIKIYKGNTSKTLVELKAKKAGKTVSETSKVYLQEKFSTLKATIPLQLRCALGEGEVSVYLEGLGAKAEETFQIKGTSRRCEQTNSSPEGADELREENEEGNDEQNQEQKGEEIFGTSGESQKFNFTFEKIPEVISAGENFSVRVQIRNNNQHHNYTLWAYLYWGSTCYSCAESTAERNASMHKIIVAPQEEKAVEFLLPVDANAESGEYKVKVKLLKDGQSTAKELTATVVLMEGKERNNEDSNKVTGAFAFPSSKKEKYSEQKNYFSAKGITVYQTPDAKTVELAPLLLAVAFALVIVVMMAGKSKKA